MDDDVPGNGAGGDRRASRRTLFACSVAAATVALVAAVGSSDSRSARFDVLDVQRINIREPDGTLRMALSNKAQLPGLLVKGREFPHKRAQAGLLFYNDEGSELGGLIFDGQRDAKGLPQSGASLTFDRYEQDQQLQLAGFDNDGRAYAGMTVKDVPGHSILDLIEEQPRLAAMPPDERRKLMVERKRTNYYGARRLYVGKTPDQDSVVQLSDASGRPRLQLQVTPDGMASIGFLDAAGNVVAEITPGDFTKR